MVDDADLSILTALGKDPLGTVQDIGRSTGMTSATISIRLKKLRETGALFSVSAQLAYPALGLEPAVAFIEAPFKALSRLETLLDRHPYTRYRVRCIGSYNGLYGLFAVPDGALPILRDFLDELKGETITDYRLDTPTSGWAYSEVDYGLYDMGKDQWSFDWANWEASLDSVSLSITLPKLPYSLLRRLDVKDLRILEQLTIDARRKGKRIAADIGITPYHFTRRMQFLNENEVIDSYRVIVDKGVSRLVTTFMFLCQCNPDETKRFSSAFTNLPFQSTFIPTHKGFFVQASIPPLDLPILGSILQQRCDRVESIWSDYRSSMRYYFWPGAYSDGAWDDSHDFMVDKVLGGVD
jgi:DNA-binding Lrp family transcriptional regulator